MPSSRKIADELLLGLLYDPQDLCSCDFPDVDFEPLNDVDGEKFELGNDPDTRPYMELIDINGEFPSCWEEGKDVDPDDDDDDSWSIDVNLDSSEAQDLVFMRSGSSFNSFVAWLDTGQKLTLCIDVLRTLWGLYWDIVRFIFGSGNKESFSC